MLSVHGCVNARVRVRVRARVRVTYLLAVPPREGQARNDESRYSNRVLWTEGALALDLVVRGLALVLVVRGLALVLVLILAM